MIGCEEFGIGNYFGCWKNYHSPEGQGDMSFICQARSVLFMGERLVYFCIPKLIQREGERERVERRGVGRERERQTYREKEREMSISLCQCMHMYCLTQFCVRVCNCEYLQSLFAIMYMYMSTVLPTNSLETYIFVTHQ